MRLRPLSTLPTRAARRARAAVDTRRRERAARVYREQAATLTDGRDDAYRAYVETQLDRTLPRFAHDPGVGQRLLVAAAAAAAPPGAKVLCVGCRNGLELDAFRAAGHPDVRGIDLFSQRDDILVMDMHAMTFPDASFDVVYSSHSLEHAQRVEVVAGELVRVARPGAVVAVEVPVRHRGSDADLVVFDGMETLEGLFGEAVGEVLLREELGPHSERNDQGSDVARLVFRVRHEPTHTA